MKHTDAPTRAHAYLILSPFIWHSSHTNITSPFALSLYVPSVHTCMRTTTHTSILYRRTECICATRCALSGGCDLRLQIILSALWGMQRCFRHLFFFICPFFFNFCHQLSRWEQCSLTSILAHEIKSLGYICLLLSYVLTGKMEHTAHTAMITDIEKQNLDVKTIGRAGSHVSLINYWCLVTDTYGVCERDSKI